MELIDTHCHIHSSDFPLTIAEVELRAAQAGIKQLLCVGTDIEDSRRAIEFVRNRKNHWASVGLHPHEAKEGETALYGLRKLFDASMYTVGPVARSAPENFASQTFSGAAPPRATHGFDISEAKRNISKIVAIGECGLDYFYGHSPKTDQEKALRYQIELALEHNLPIIFHVREAFEDFWPVFDSYKDLRGVLHSFTDNRQNLDKALERNLYIGINGIMTFTKNDWQLAVARAIPLNKIVLETDAPFLTPTPLRGKVNEPANALLVANFIAELRHESIEKIAAATTKNARLLFSI